MIIRKIKEDFQQLAEKITAYAFYPKRIFRLIELYGENNIYNCYFDN